jgi:DNA repair exonuclease SbcCD nuclease subunit
MFYLISADWHLGYEPQQSPARSRDFYTAGRFLIQKVCQNKDCAGILILGDVRDTPLIYPQHFQSLLEFIGLTQQANKTIGLLMGNHDQTSPSWVQVLATNFRSVGDLSTPQGIAKVGLDPNLVRGIHYTHRLHLAEKIRETPATCSTLLLHQSLEETVQGAPFYDINAETVRSLLPDNPHLTLFSGDIHNPSDTSLEEFNTRVLSPGSLQVTDCNELSFGENEKYFIVAEGPNLENPRHVELPGAITRPWAYIQIATENDLENLKHKLSSLASLWAESKRPPGIVRIRTLPDLYFATQLILANTEELKTQFLECRLQVKALRAAPPNDDPQITDQLHEIRKDRRAWLLTQIEQLAANDPKLTPKSQALIRALCRNQNKTKKEVRETTDQWRKNHNANPIPVSKE